MPNNDCSFSCKSADELKTMMRFQGQVLACLESIKTNIQEMKDERRALWVEIKDVKKDVQSLYWKVGFIAGGAALVISLVVSMFKAGSK